MWFVFPQVAGLGQSPTSRYYAISGLDEARAYLRHEVLGAALLECTGRSSSSRVSGPRRSSVRCDALKLRSSMTLFGRADPAEPLFGAVLDRYFGGRPDGATEELL